jgi:hypothetical protein
LIFFNKHKLEQTHGLNSLSKSSPPYRLDITGYRKRWKTHSHRAKMDEFFSRGNCWVPQLRMGEFISGLMQISIIQKRSFTRVKFNHLINTLTFSFTYEAQAQTRKNI